MGILESGSISGPLKASLGYTTQSTAYGSFLSVSDMLKDYEKIKADTCNKSALDKLTQSMPKQKLVLAPRQYGKSLTSTYFDEYHRGKFGDIYSHNLFPKLRPPIKEGKEDKIEKEAKFKVGDYAVVVGSCNLRGHTVVITGFRSPTAPKFKSTSENLVCWEMENDLRKATPEEIAEALGGKLKVGDIVRITDPKHPNYGCVTKIMDWRLNDFSPNGNVGVYCGLKHPTEDTVSISGLQLVKLEVGDKVRILQHKAYADSGITNYVGEKSVGKIGRIREINTTSTMVKHPYMLYDDVRDTEYMGYYALSELELITKEEAKPMATYKIGDYVRITGDDVDGDEDSDMPLGHVGKITSVDYGYDNDDNTGVNDGYAYCVDHGYMYGAASLEEAAPPKEQAVERAERVRSFAIGDKIRCVEPSEGGRTGAGWKLGKEFVIASMTGGGDILWPAGGGGGVYHEAAELVNNNNQGDINMSVSSNPLKAIMENELDADTRLLRQIGFENEDGTVSGDGQRAVIQCLYAEHRADFAAKYRKALAVEESAAKVAEEKKAAK